MLLGHPGRCRHSLLSRVAGATSRHGKTSAIGIGITCSARFRLCRSIQHATMDRVAGSLGHCARILPLAEIVLTLWDFVVEDWVRKSLGGLYPGEHAALGIFNDWPNASDLLGFMMVDTYDSRDLPRAIFVLPYMNELRFTDSAMVLFPGVKESMNSNLNRTVPRQRVNFKCSGH